MDVHEIGARVWGFVVCSETSLDQRIARFRQAPVEYPMEEITIRSVRVEDVHRMGRFGPPSEVWAVCLLVAATIRHVSREDEVEEDARGNAGDRPAFLSP